MVSALVSGLRCPGSSHSQVSQLFCPSLFRLLILMFCISGEFADVYKGILKTREGKKIVAVKVLRAS